MLSSESLRQCDTSQLRTCGVCYERPLFFNEDDLNAHYKKHHRKQAGCRTLTKQMKVLEKSKKILVNKLEDIQAELQRLRQNGMTKKRTLDVVRKEIHNIQHQISEKNQQIDQLRVALCQDEECKLTVDCSKSSDNQRRLMAAFKEKVDAEFLNLLVSMSHDIPISGSSSVSRISKSSDDEKHEKSTEKRLTLLESEVQQLKECSVGKEIIVQADLKNCESLESELKDKGEELIKCNDSISELKKLVEEKDKEVLLLNVKCQNSQEFQLHAKTSLEQMLMQTSSDKDQMEARNLELAKELMDTLSSLKFAEKTVDKLKKERKSLETESTSNMVEMQRLATEMGNLRKVASKENVEDYKRKLSMLEEQLTRADSELQRKTEQFKECQGKLVERFEQESVLKDEIKSLMCEKIELTKLIQEIRIEAKADEQQDEDLREQMEALQVTYDLVVRENEVNAARLLEVDKIREDQKHEIEQVVKEKDAKEKELNKVMVERDNLQQELMVITKDHSNCNESIEALKLSNEESVKVFNENEKESSRMKGVLLQSQKCVENLQNQLEEAHTKHKCSVEEREKLKDEKKELEKRIETLESDLTAERKTSSCDMQRIHDLETALQDAQQSKDVAVSQLNENEKLQTQIGRVIGELERERSSAIEARDRLSEVKKAHERCGQENEKSIESLNEAFAKERAAFQKELQLREDAHSKTVMSFEEEHSNLKESIHQLEITITKFEAERCEDNKMLTQTEEQHELAEMQDIFFKQKAVLEHQVAALTADLADKESMYSKEICRLKNEIAQGGTVIDAQTENSGQDVKEREAEKQILKLTSDIEQQEVKLLGQLNEQVARNQELEKKLFIAEDELRKLKSLPGIESPPDGNCGKEEADLSSSDGDSRNSKTSIQSNSSKRSTNTNKSSIPSSKRSLESETSKESTLPEQSNDSISSKRSVGSRKSISSKQTEISKESLPPKQSNDSIPSKRSEDSIKPNSSKQSETSKETAPPKQSNDSISSKRSEDSRKSNSSKQSEISKESAPLKQSNDSVSSKRSEGSRKSISLKKSETSKESAASKQSNNSNSSKISEDSRRSTSRKSNTAKQPDEPKESVQSKQSDDSISSKRSAVSKLSDNSRESNTKRRPETPKESVNSKKSNDSISSKRFVDSKQSNDSISSKHSDTRESTDSKTSNSSNQSGKSRDSSSNKRSDTRESNFSKQPTGTFSKESKKSDSRKDSKVSKQPGDSISEEIEKSISEEINPISWSYRSSVDKVRTSDQSFGSDGFFPFDEDCLPKDDDDVLSDDFFGTKSNNKCNGQNENVPKKTKKKKTGKKKKAKEKEKEKEEGLLPLSLPPLKGGLPPLKLRPLPGDLPPLTRPPIAAAAPIGLPIQENEVANKLEVINTIERQTSNNDLSIVRSQKSNLHLDINLDECHSHQNYDKEERKCHDVIIVKPTKSQKSGGFFENLSPLPDSKSSLLTTAGKTSPCTKVADDKDCVLDPLDDIDALLQDLDEFDEKKQIF